MAVDSYELAKTWAQPDTGDALKFKWGEVVAVKSNGTLSVKIAGFANAIECQNWCASAVGYVVGVVCKGTKWFAVCSTFQGKMLLIHSYGFNPTAKTLKVATSSPLKDNQHFCYTSSAGVDTKLSHVVSGGVYTVSGVTPGMTIWVGED